MKKWKIWVMVIALFISGLLLGSAGTVIYVRYSIERIIRGGPPAVRQVVLKKLTRDLKLTEDQKARVDLIVRSGQEQIRAIRLQEEPRIERILEEGIGEIKSILHPEQQARLDVLWRKARSRLLISARTEENPAAK